MEGRKRVGFGVVPDGEARRFFGVEKVVLVRSLGRMGGLMP